MYCIYKRLKRNRRDNLLFIEQIKMNMMMMMMMISKYYGMSRVFSAVVGLLVAVTYLADRRVCGLCIASEAVRVVHASITASSGGKRRCDELSGLGLQGAEGVVVQGRCAGQSRLQSASVERRREST